MTPIRVPVPVPVPRLPATRAAALAAAALAATLAAATPAAHAQPGLLTVPAVDLQRYAGLWHEAARLPNRFQSHCVADTTARYTPRDDGTVTVVNRCRTKAEGTPEWDEAEGLARPVDATNARLKVSFLPAALRWLPIGWGDYWVIELDPEYRWAVVGEPDRRYLWVLSRTESLPRETLDGILGRARERGFPVDRVVRADGGSAPGTGSAATATPAPPPPPPR
jgi:apolipoprotein D and lipocalin family protein